MKLNNYFKKHYSVDEIKFLSELINTNMPLDMCLDIISSSKNKSIKDKIMSLLSEGYMFEDIIVNYVPQNLANYLNRLIKLLGFNKAVKIAINIIDERKRNIEDILKKAIYPLILMLISFLALIIFDAFALDSIIQMMSSFVDDTFTILIFRNIFGIFVKLLIILIGFCFICIGYIKIFKKETFVYDLINKNIKDNIINIYYTNEFSFLFLILARNGYKTKEIIDIIKQMDNLKISSYLALNLEKGLVFGDDIFKASDTYLFDSGLSKFLKIGAYTKDYLSILEKYIEYCGEKIRSFIKKLTAFLQGFSYALIGIVIIFVYELLFMPMQAITSF